MSADRLRAASKAVRAASKAVSDAKPCTDRHLYADARMRKLGFASCSVAEAVADWLDTAGADEWAHGPHCMTPCDDCDDDHRAPHVRAAFALADQILGGAS